MPAATFEKVGCAPFCKTGQTFEEHSSVTSFRAMRTRRRAAAYIEAHPCRFVVEGNCRLAEFLTREALGASIKQARVEAIDMKREET